FRVRNGLGGKVCDWDAWRWLGFGLLLGPLYFVATFLVLLFIIWPPFLGCALLVCCLTPSSRRSSSLWGLAYGLRNLVSHFGPFLFCASTFPRQPSPCKSSPAPLTHYPRSSIKL